MIYVKSEKEIDLIRESCKIVRDTLQFIDVYSSTGTPVVVVNGDEVAVRRIAEGHYSADSVVIRGTAEVIAYDSLRMRSDRVVLRCGESY